MPFQGTLNRVIDKEKQWILLINVDGHGDKWFTLFDKKFAGQDSKENKALCDVHTMIGKRVIYSAVKGALKDKTGPEDGERFNPVIESIILETVDIPSVRDMAKEISEAEAKNEALVSGITNDVHRKASESDSVQEDAQIHVDDKYCRLRAATMDMLGSVGKWTAEVERLLKEA